MDFLAIFKVFGLDAAAAAGTILDSGQAPSPHAQGWNKPQGETPRSDFELDLSFGIFRLGSFVWDLRLGILGLENGAHTCVCGSPDG